jgi:RNA polymerase sigma factor (sigma-70 family)
MPLTPTHQITSRARVAGGDVSQLVARAADGDRVAWDTLFERFGGVVWAATRTHRLTDADAADVHQQTWMRLVENLDRIHDPERLGSWLATTARRECLAVIRRTARLIPRGDDLPDRPCERPRPGERLIIEQRAVALRGALERVKPRDRALLRMLAAEPAPSYDKIGAALGMPIGSIGPTRARALASLRREVERAGLRAA